MGSNSKGLNTTSMPLYLMIFKGSLNCETSKEACDILVVSHEGASVVKMARIGICKIMEYLVNFMFNCAIL